MAITPLPPAPEPSDTQAQFNTKAFALVAALNQFVTETNATAAAVDADAATATDQAGIATVQAGIATTKADAASASAALAKDWATKTSDEVVAGQGFGAKKYANDAAISAAAAAASALEAAGLMESYQGALAADPTVDKNGNPLTAGDWYVNTSTGYIRVYTGSAWVQGISVVAGVSSLNGLTGALTGFVTETATQSLTNKTLSGAILNDGYTEEVFAVSGTTPALSPTNGSIQTWTLSGNSTPTAGTWAAGQSMTLMVNDGTAFTITWTSLGVVWVGGTAPTLATSGFTVLHLWKVGSTIYGVKAGEVA